MGIEDMEYMLPLLMPIALSLVVGLATSIPLIRYARKRDWFAGGHIITRRQFEAKVEQAFLDRPLLPPDQFYETYFEALSIPKDIPIRIRRIFEEHFDADFSRLKDDDDFSKELSFFWDYDSMVDVEIVLALEKEFGITISDGEATDMKTIRAIVETIWKKKQDAQPSGGAYFDPAAGSKSAHP